MASQGVSRKRAAPGASPMPYSQQMQNPPPTYNDGAGAQLSNDQFLQWGQTGQGSAQYNESNYAMNSSAFPQNHSQPSNQLTRRPTTQLTTRGRLSDDPNPWTDNPTGLPGNGDPEWSDDIADLEAKAQVAKKEAQGKRKQIPPFVQKLNR